MPGIFHAVFGMMVSLPLWKISKDEDDVPKFSLGLPVIFAINNYIGPDFSAVLRIMGKALDNEPLQEFAGSVS